jgi:FkbM family methyltransferase
MIKKALKAILGQKLIDKIKQREVKREPLVIPQDNPEEIALRKNFYKQFVKQGDVTFDVGANVGNRISPMLELGANVIAIEPQEYCKQVLMAKFGNKIQLEPFGLGEKEEVKEFFISNASTISSFSKDWIESVKQDRFKEYTWNKVQKVQMTTLDNLIKKHGRPVFIKIDVEGYEPEVLKGLHQAVPCISYEYTTPEQTSKAIECLEHIASLSKHVVCNYSEGESMELSLSEWVSKEKMLEIINSESFINTGFGDIYVKSEVE